MIKKATQFSLMIGIAGFVALLIWQGIGDITHTLAAAGWGLLLVTGFHVIPMLSSSVCWRVLLPDLHRPSLIRLLIARWIGESVNSMLPVAQIGGEIAKARWMMRRGQHQYAIPATVAGSSVVVEVTLSLLTQIIFTLVGLVTLLFYLELNHTLLLEIIIGMLVMVGALAAFYASQRRNLFARAAQLLKIIAGGKAWLTLSGGAAAMDQAIVDIYQHKKTVITSSAWRLLSWFLGIGEVYLLMYFLGHPVSLVEALLLESLGQAIRAAGFLIPASLGIQEGGFLLLGTLLGIPPHTALALSLGKRVREIMLGIPGLIVWQRGAGQRVWQSRQTGSMPQTVPEAEES